MKKIISLLLTIILISSCRSNKRTTSNRNTSKHKKTIQHKTNRVVVKSIQNNSKTKVKTPLYVDISENKTIFDVALLDVLHANKPNLLIAKVDYIKKYSELAIHEMEVYKIPASITLAQGLLESRYGKSVLTTKAKNHFGIKCHKWKGQRVYHDDDAKGECFRKYETDEASYRDHSLFLADRKRYAKLFTYALNDYKSWAKGLRAAGYATDKKYPQKLIALIEEYELYYFDTLVLGEDYEFKNDVNIVETNKITKPKKSISTNLTNSNTYVVEFGDTLYSISKKKNVSLTALKNLNKLNTNEISIGQELILSKKIVKKNIKYVVKVGDTIYSIAKKNQTTVSNLMEINNLKSNNITIGQLLIIK